MCRHTGRRVTVPTVGQELQRVNWQSDAKRTNPRFIPMFSHSVTELRQPIARVDKSVPFRTSPRDVRANHEFDLLGARRASCP